MLGSYRLGCTHEKDLAHEGERQRSPHVAIVQRRHHDISQENTDVNVELVGQRCPEAKTVDKVPVEAQRQHTHALVTSGAAEDVPYH